MSVIIGGTTGITFPSGSLQNSGVIAWAKFNGNTGAITASNNITSITRNAAGTYTAIMTTAAVDANYILVGAVTFQTGYTSSATITMNGNFTLTTTTFQFYNLTYTATGSDNPVVGFAIIR